MAVSLKHKKQTGLPAASGNAAEVQSTDWTDEHDLRITGPALVGRVAGTAGAVEEIPLGAGLAFVAGALAASGSASDLTSGTVPFARLPVAADGEVNSAEVVRADDARLSDARTPVAHNQAISTITNLQASLDGKAALGGATFTGGVKTMARALTDAATVTPDLALGNMFALLATSGVGSTRELAKPANVAAGEGAAVEVFYTQDATGSRALTFGSGIVLRSGTITTTANATSIISLRTVDGGTTWYAAIL